MAEYAYVFFQNHLSKCLWNLFSAKIGYLFYAWWISNLLVKMDSYFCFDCCDRSRQKINIVFAVKNSTHLLWPLSNMYWSIFTLWHTFVILRDVFARKNHSENRTDLHMWVTWTYMGLVLDLHDLHESRMTCTGLKITFWKLTCIILSIGFHLAFLFVSLEIT